MLRNIAILAAAAGILAACNGSGGGGIFSGIASLGPTFTRAFAQPANGTPVTVDANSLRLTPTQEPFNP